MLLIFQLNYRVAAEIKTKIVPLTFLNKAVVDWTPDQARHATRTTFRYKRQPFRQAAIVFSDVYVFFQTVIKEITIEYAAVS